MRHVARRLNLGARLPAPRAICNFANGSRCAICTTIPQHLAADFTSDGVGQYLRELHTGIDRLWSGMGRAALARSDAGQRHTITHQGISREHPVMSAVLPDGSRVQIVAPPATRGNLVLAIRKQIASKLTLADYARSNAFEGASRGELRVVEDAGASGFGLLEEADLAAALAKAVAERRNILISGGTSTGKTTFLNALIREIPKTERLILIEDTPELRVEHDNHIGLIAVRGELGEARVTANDLVTASLRLRPDRIILGELRGSEAFAFLRAINSGHPGSMTTIHADSPESAIEQLVLLVLQAGTALSRADIRHYVAQTIDVFVQLRRGPHGRYVERVSTHGRAT
jgi:type IV secretion system protein VirB11